MGKVVAVVGMCGAGKSVVSDFLVNNNFKFIRFGQLTLDICKEQGVSGEAEERKVRENLRQEHGMAAFAILNIPKIAELLKSGNQVVVDGLYSWSEYKVLKDKYNDEFKVISIWSPPKLRYERLTGRDKKYSQDKDLRHRSFSSEEAKSRDYAEIENIEKGGPIAMADYTIVNDGDIDKLNKQIEEILNKINNES